MNDMDIFNPSPEKSLDAFLQEQVNQKAFAVAFKEWYGRYGNITFEKNLNGDIEPIWNQAGTRERYSVKSMANVFMLGFRYGEGFKIRKMVCANCETHIGMKCKNCGHAVVRSCFKEINLVRHAGNTSGDMCFVDMCSCVDAEVET